ncbi:MAG: hypothetical protein Alis3KO_12920 [Aliiglaciecola sp.]
MSKQNISNSQDSRRWFLKKLGATLGTSAAATLVTATGVTSALAYTPKNDSHLSDGKVLNKKQMQVLRELCETVLPRTDTPGAADVDCHGFIDHQLSQCHSKQQQQSVRELINTVEGRAQTLKVSSYTKMTPQQKTDLLVKIESRDGFSETLHTDFKFLKGLILFGYFTSEIGATQVLNYQAVPGGYKGSVPVTAETKVYGSLNYY